MSAYDDFITRILNIDPDRIEKIDTAADDEGGLLIKATLMTHISSGTTPHQQENKTCKL